MSKKKKKKSPFNAFVTKIFTHRRENRENALPKEYLMAVADKLHRLNPTKEIIYNTLLEVSGLIYEKGYTKRWDDFLWFKQKQEKHFEEEYGQFLDFLDDLSHSKDDNFISFSAWEENQRLLKIQNQSNNQPK